MFKASVILVLMWSSGYLGAEMAARYSSWHMLLSCRFAVAAVLLIGFCLVRRLRITRAGIARQVGIGVVMQGLYLGAISAAVGAGLSPGITALVCSLQPLVVAAVAVPILGERIGPREWLGLAVGIVGVGLVVGGKMNSGGAPWWAYLMCVGGMLALVFGTLTQRRINAPEPMAAALAVQCVVGAAIFWVVNVIVADVVPPMTFDFAWSLAWAIGFATFGGWGAYMWVNREAGPMHVSTLLLLVPPTTILLAWPMFGDAVGPWEIVGVVVSALGVAIKLVGGRAHAENAQSAPQRTPARDTEVCGPELIRNERG
ncbi:drug/metabolite transporter (DMT)-like permease [Williamsia limnetica]|uniref:Drug/metabolite transporter (DMT)-like permease n=1 Tax=Williamsia limnetica TaxID=882452 RepID=A0A318RSV1_WILLI|nr:DMT family transporter [Williamsia limnetica]PYE19147.1 drug/metabolite transporter (DMT)-like permease [Williamsia limnetica]